MTQNYCTLYSKKSLDIYNCKTFYCIYIILTSNLSPKGACFEASLITLILPRTHRQKNRRSVFVLRQAAANLIQNQQIKTLNYQNQSQNIVLVYAAHLQK